MREREENFALIIACIGEAYTTKGNSNKEFDSTLAYSIAEEVVKNAYKLKIANSDKDTAINALGEIIFSKCLPVYLLSKAIYAYRKLRGEFDK